MSRPPTNMTGASCSSSSGGYEFMPNESTTEKIDPLSCFQCPITLVCA